ncbi:MAG TPA: DUF1573 domain-containing protein [Arachidicoccus sp.]
MQKFILSLFVACIVFCACSNNSGKVPRNRMEQQDDTTNYTTIQWLDSMKDFGTAKYGDKVNINYRFKNVGSKPLYLLDVRPTCGCTIADYTKNAVMPGNEGFVKAIYDSYHNEPGSVRKSIIVTSNTINDNHFVLAFTGNVVK